MKTLTIDDIVSGAQYSVAHPEKYDQSKWCGTVCCVLGHARALANSDQPNEELRKGEFPDDSPRAKMIKSMLRWTHEDTAGLIPLVQEDGILVTTKRVGKFGKGVRINSNAWIDSGVSIDSNVMIGSDVRINSNAWIDSGVSIDSNAWIDSGVSIGEDVMIGSGARIGSGVSIGEDVMIGPGVMIGNNVSIDWDVRIGSNVSIGSGVNIGEDVSIEANSIVTEDVLK